eukprot:TRINITY_DN10_c0_g1_i1.p1 TRINITY_DN10_c0_g1~~TRINITY_DN10_c0_g1_i1.p1  ORF type:complete len:290 (+),score=75.15 TRINITY_DN10_c0_g1_i1:217-1086(+)
MAIITGSVVANKYELGYQIGSGKCAVVHEAVNLENGERVAAKIQTVPVEPKSRARQRIMHELTIHKLLSSTGHPHILPLNDVAELPDTLYIFLQRAKCDLFALVESTNGFSEAVARLYTLELLSGLEHCHQNNIFHRDLKPENVLVDQAGHLMLADFGFACVADRDQNLQDRVGTEAYAAPEVMDHMSKGYQGGPADIWSLGVTLFIMVACCFPFQMATPKCQFFRSHMQGSFKFPDHISPELESLLLAMWEVNPEDRITLSELRQHEWFTDSYGDDLTDCMETDELCD